MQQWNNETMKSGFTLIESLVTILIVSILVFGIYQLTDFAVKITGDNKFRVAATIIGNQKLERIRNLPYDSIGTISGIVQGVIPDNETVVQGTDTFHVNTLIKYEDDVFDGISGGTDTIPTDYKSINIKVTWNGPLGEKNITISSLVAPRGIETSAGGGTLSISVFNASGLPVDLSDVHIENNNVDPVINLDATTNDQGKLVFYGAAISTESYEITTTKTGYSTAYTSSRTPENPNPTKPHATVIEDQKTEISFIIDLLSNLNIKTIQQDLLENWKINTDVGANEQMKPDLTIDENGNFYFVWQDYRQGSDSKIYAQKYDTSRNPVWTGDAVIGTANGQINPTIISDSVGNLYIAWNDNRNGNQDAYFIKTDNGGNDVWGGEKKINTDAGNKDQSNPAVAITESGGTATTTVAWQDNRNDNWDIYAQKFDELGNYIWGSEVLINTDGGATDQYSPTLITDSDDNTYITWIDERNGNKDIYSQKFDAIGIKLWTPDLKVNTDTTATDQYSPALAIDSNNNLYIVWTDERNGNKDVYAQKYDSSGTKLWTSDLKINTDTTATDQYSPDLTIDSGNNIYFVWTDEREENSDIYAQKYNSAGTKLWTSDIRININTGPSNQSTPNITINPNTNEAYACWYDARGGEYYDIYASKVGPYGTPVNLANIPITITGAKKIGENPIIYKYNQDHTSDATGYVNLNNIEWDSYDIKLQDGYTTHEIIMTNPVVPSSLSPNETLEVILYLNNPT